MYSSAEILKSVNAYLANLKYERKPKGLYEPIEYVLSMGGKRVRPVLMLLSYNMYKDNPETILSSACFIGKICDATLIITCRYANVVNMQFFCLPLPKTRH